VQPPPRLDDIREDVPVPVCKAIEKALRKEPADRFQDAAELIDALGEQRAAAIQHLACDQHPKVAPPAEEKSRWPQQL
jgi:hypothetical protein